MFLDFLFLVAFTDHLELVVQPLCLLDPRLHSPVKGNHTGNDDHKGNCEPGIKEADHQNLTQCQEKVLPTGFYMEWDLGVHYQNK